MSWVISLIVLYLLFVYSVGIPLLRKDYKYIPRPFSEEQMTDIRIEYIIMPIAIPIRFFYYCLNSHFFNYIIIKIMGDKDKDD